MSEVQPHTVGIKAQYAEQVTADLERNAKEQERLRTEVTALQEQLTALQEDQAVLLGVQKALAGDNPVPTAVETAAVPGPRETPTASRRKKGKHKDTAQQAAAKTPNTRAEAAQPTLVKLVNRHLAQESEPRSAAEITSALSQAHPERNVKTTVVRTTVENLVAKGLVERSKQGKSVFYAAAPGEQTPESHERQAANAEK
ncbi:BlaI/MecI/CopY family transcriptional regulator [Streptomyces sp. NPDC002619]|uniref:BlaI/MecI/CopY family transcriptional regulator n=1 Tax=Streptomyces sp. NPDC002619 TaxID=3364655 RepID=UPI00368945FB